MTKAVNITQLEKVYSNGFKALKGINLEIQKGDFFALLGSNGAGKSTTINILCSLVNKTHGNVSVFGHDLDTQRELVKAEIGLVPQEFNFNVFEPIKEIIISQGGYYGIPRKEATKRAQEVLEQLDLWDKRAEAARNLSGGMKRRLMIARALIHQPRLLILDEPTAGVDIEIRRTMWDFMQNINEQGTTIILTTHYLEEAENLCRNIAIINQGEVVEDTSMKELLGRLQQEHFVLDLQAPITQIPLCEQFHIHPRDETTLEIAINKKYSLNTIFDFFNQHNIKVKSMRNRSNRLEQLFIDLVSSNQAEK